MNKLTLGTLVSACLATSAVAQNFPYSLPFNAANDFSKIGVEWAEEVSKATNGKINFQPDFNAALVSVPEALDATGTGVVPASQVIVSAITGTIPALAFIEMNDGVPMDNPLPEDAMAQIFPEIEELLAPHGVKALWMVPAFGGGIACRDGFLETADDWQGKKIRSAGRWQAKQVEALGGVPIALPATDVYTALQNGTVDCALTVPNNFMAGSLYEVAPYYSGYDTTGNGLITVVGTDVWESLSEEEREIVSRVSKEMITKGTKRLREINNEAILGIDAKAKRFMMTTEERNRLVRKWDAVFQELAASVTDDAGKRLVTKMYSFRPQQ